MNSKEAVVVANKKCKITKEGIRSELYNFGAWYSKCSGYCHGPVWRLYQRKLFFGWIRQFVTNDPRIVLRWKKEFFGK